MKKLILILLFLSACAARVYVKELDVRVGDAESLQVLPQATPAPN